MSNGKSRFAISTMSDKHWPITAAMCLSRPGKCTAHLLRTVNNDSFAARPYPLAPSGDQDRKKWERPLIPVINSGTRIPNGQVAGFPSLKKITGSLIKLPVMKIQVRFVNPRWFHVSISRKNGGPTWIRTRDQPVMSRELYQLSYGPEPLQQELMIIVPLRAVKAPQR